MRPLLALLLVLSAVTSASAQEDPPGSWAVRAPGPYAMAGAASCVDGSYAYAWGGSGGNTTHVRYDPATDSWTPLAGLPTAVYNAAGVSFRGFNYSFGNSSSPQGLVLRYDPAADSWATLAGGNPHLYRAAAATDGASIHLLGGYSAGGYAGRFTRYDVERGTFEALPPLEGGALNGPSLAWSPATGSYFATHGTSCWEFAGAWRRRADAPGDRQLHASFVALNGRLYLLGGTRGPLVDEYRPASDSWAPRAPSPGAHPSRPGAGLLGARGWLWGGGGGCAQFTPPVFGRPPGLPLDATQTGPAGPVEPGGWTGSVITLGAVLSDPDDGQALRLVVQVKPSAAPWSAALTRATPFADPGPRSIEIALAGPGEHDWRYRVEDDEGNATPSLDGLPGWIEFDPAGPDFRSDQSAPGAPLLLGPADGDLQVADPDSGAVELSWTAADDDGPPERLRYEIEVAYGDPGFASPEVRIEGLAETSARVRLATGRKPHSWRVRATDGVGWVGPWSRTGAFRVLHDDGLDHAGGDGACSAGGPGRAPLLPALVLLAALLAASRRPVTHS